MAHPVRLCLALECTTRLGSLWQSLLKGVVEPLLAHQARLGLELALVLFGAHPPHSLATVESSLGWCSSAEHLRRLLDDLEFVGGGGQPVALAEALLEAAALFAMPASSPGAPAPQQHLLVCMASEPAVRPVPWPFADDCGMAKIPGLATSAELFHAFHRRGIQLSLAGGNIMLNLPLLWHVTNLVSEVPLSLSEARLDQLKQSQEGLLQQLVLSAVILPGGAMALLPFWQQALEVLLKAGGKHLSPSAALAAANTSLASAHGIASSELAVGVASDGLEPPPPHSEEPAAKRARLGTAPLPSLTAAAAAAAGAASTVPHASPQQQSSAMPPPAPLQWTPPAAAEPTPPLAANASPGSFMAIMNAEILVSPDDASPMGDAMLATMMQQAAPPAPQVQGPSVTGLPLPPVQQEQEQQQMMMRQGVAAAGLPAGSDPGLLPPGGAQKYVLIHTAKVVVDGKVTRGGSLILGMGQVQALPQQASVLLAMVWPPELHIAKNVAMLQAQSFINSKPSCIHMRLKIQYTSHEARGFPERLMRMGAAGIVPLHSNTLGIMLPFQHHDSREVLLRLVVVPNASTYVG